jgi:hypothetical protein
MLVFWLKFAIHHQTRLFQSFINLGVNALTKSQGKRAWVSDVKSINPIPPKIMGKVAMFHKVLTFDLVSFPPHIKLRYDD